MKVRIFLFTLLVLLVSVSGKAQFKYGIRGGINSSTISLGNSTFSIYNPSYPDIPDEYKISYKSGSLGFHIGGLVQYYLLTDFFVQPELYFTSVKNDIQIVRKTWVADGDWGFFDPIDDAGQQKFNKMDLPVLLGYRLGPLRLSAGPVASMLLSANSDMLDEFQIKQNFLNTNYGYQLGVGLELASLIIDVKYEGHLSPISNGISIKGEDFNFDQRMGQWMLSIGFVLGNE